MIWTIEIFRLLNNLKFSEKKTMSEMLYFFFKLSVLEPTIIMPKISSPQFHWPCFRREILSKKNGRSISHFYTIPCHNIFFSHSHSLASIPHLQGVATKQNFTDKVPLSMIGVL